MVYKNLITHERELQGDLLRQRRDFYAISLGLILFHLAGGRMNDTATLSSLPVHLSSPNVLYWAAWVSFVYFGLRYWVLDPGSWKRFNEEWERQTRASSSFRKLMIRWINRCVSDEHAQRWCQAVNGGFRPPMRTINGDAALDISSLAHLRTESRLNLPSQYAPPQLSPLSTIELRGLRRARTAGFMRAVFLERTATDLLLPYAMGALAVLISLWVSLQLTARLGWLLGAN